MKIMYMGTPTFAARVLEIVAEEFPDSEIMAVTKADTPKGRSYKLQPCETKQKAIELGFETVTPESLKEEGFGGTLLSFAPDVIIVAAFGKILPEYVLNFPKYGCINVHGSLLPEYRGAAPVNRAIMDGKTKTGITVMYMEKGLDTGDMLSKEEVDIPEGMTATELFSALAEVGGRLVCKTLRNIISGNATREKQDDRLSTYAQKITSEDQKIDWSASAFEITRLIHGLSEEPSAITHMPDGRLLKLYRAQASDDTFDAPCGQVTVAKKRIQVACGKGSVILNELQLEGGKRMTAADFLNGRKINLGDILC